MFSFLDGWARSLNKARGESAEAHALPWVCRQVGYGFELAAPVWLAVLSLWISTLVGFLWLVVVVGAIFQKVTDMQVFI